MNADRASRDAADQRGTSAPGDGSAANTKVGLEPLKQHVMGNCIKRRRYVQSAAVYTYTVHDMLQRSLGGMAAAER